VQVAHRNTLGTPGITWRRPGCVVEVSMNACDNASAILVVERHDRALRRKSA